MTELPDIPSELIRLALSDLQKCEADPAYYINMGLWHKPTSGGNACMVCLAGAVMAKSLNMPKNEELFPNIFDHTTDCKLNALNDFRLGCVKDGLNSMYIENDLGDELDRHITPYEEDKEKFFSDMTKLADDLEEVGL